MALYNIYAGLKNTNFDMEIHNQDFPTVEEAMNAARELAVKIYQFCIGYYWEDCWDELNGNPSDRLYTDEEVSRYYYDDVNQKMNYYVKPSAKHCYVF